MSGKSVAAAGTLGHIRTIMILVLIVQTGHLVTNIVQLGGLYTTGTQFARTTDNTEQMRIQVETAVKKVAPGLDWVAANLPQDNTLLMFKQLMGIASNLHSVSEKVASMSPEQIETLMSNVTMIAIKANEMISKLSPERNAEFINQLQRIAIGINITKVELASAYLSNILQETSNTHLMDHVGSLLSKFDLLQIKS